MDVFGYQDFRHHLVIRLTRLQTQVALILPLIGKRVFVRKLLSDHSLFQYEEALPLFDVRRVVSTLATLLPLSYEPLFPLVSTPGPWYVQELCHLT